MSASVCKRVLVLVQHLYANVTVDAKIVIEQQQDVPVAVMANANAVCRPNTEEESE